MHFSTILVSLAALSTAVFAGPIANPKPLIDLTPRTTSPAATKELSTRQDGSVYTATPLNYCLSLDQTNAIVAAFIWLLQSPTADNFASTAYALLDPSFSDVSDSINWLAGIPLGSVTFPSRDGFIAGSGSQPPLFVETLEIFYGCATIGWRWQSVSGVGTDAYLVKGIDEFIITPAGQIVNIFAEFNSAAFAADLAPPSS